MKPLIPVDREKIADICRRMRIRELSVFGSALRDDFLPNSDVDLLVVYEDEAGKSFSEYLKAEEELAKLFGRKVDLVIKKALRNPFIRHHILNNRTVIYAA